MPTIYNKVELDGTTLLDLSQDTVASASHIRQGYIGHLNDGSQVTGTYSGGTPTLQTKTYTVSGAGTASVTPDSGYDGLSQVNVSVPELEYEAHNSISYRTQSSQRKCDIEAWSSIEQAGFVGSGTIVAMDETFNAVPANTTITPTTSSQTIGGANYMMEGAVTVAAMPSGTAGTPTATKGTVSNHQVSVTPSVTNTTGYITGSTINGTAVTVSASELVSGSETKTANGTYDVTNLAELVVNVSGGGGGGLTVGTASTVCTLTSSLQFTGLAGQPTSIAIISTDTLTTASPPTIATVVFDGTSFHGQGITTTSNANVSYLSGGAFTPTYNNGTLTINASSAEFAYEATYNLIYTYNGSDIGTANVQVGSGATSITFTGLEEEPSYFSCIFKSNFSTSSGYQRVVAVVYDGTDIYGLEMDSSAKPSSTHWSYTYNNGSLTLSSQGTNAGGYFHQPGYYQLTYATEGDAGNYQSKTVTPTTSTQTVTADSGYDALKKVTVNAIPSEYIIPTGNLSITSNTASGQSLDVSQYATATVNVPTGGGGASFGTVTMTNSSNQNTSIGFTLPSGRTPKAFFCRLTSQIARSSNSRYYYVFDMRWDGSTTGGVAGNTFYMYSGTLTNVTSGYSYSQSGTTFTLSSTGSRSASPGSFYNGTYEMVYVY